jgi:hypothetical protein
VAGTTNVHRTGFQLDGKNITYHLWTFTAIDEFM